MIHEQGFVLTLKRIGLFDLFISVNFACALNPSVKPSANLALSSSLSMNFTSFGGLRVTFLVQSSGTAAYPSYGVAMSSLKRF